MAETHSESIVWVVPLGQHRAWDRRVTDTALETYSHRIVDSPRNMPIMLFHLEQGCSGFPEAASPSPCLNSNRSASGNYSVQASDTHFLRTGDGE